MVRFRLCLFGCLLVIFLSLQWVLWLDRYSMPSVWENQTKLSQLERTRGQLLVRNGVILAEIKDLKHGEDAIEERVRYRLGMIKPNEVFYRVYP